MPFEVPRGAELAARLSSVLEVIYLIFNEGYSATAGDDWMRPGAVRGRAAARPHPGRARAGRARGARPGRADGDPGVARCGRGSARRASRSCCSTRTARAGTSCSSAAAWPRSSAPRRSAARRAPTRCRRRSPPVTRGRARRTRPTGRASPRSTTRSPSSRPSPVVELNRAVAVAMAFGPAAGLELVDALRVEPSLKGYHLLPSVRGDLLPSSAASTRRARSSSARRRSRATPASATCCSSARPPARARRLIPEFVEVPMDRPSARYESEVREAAAPGVLARWSTWGPYFRSILRIVAAYPFILSGTMKLFAFPAGIPPNGGTVSLLSQIGIGALLEVFGGALMLVGLFTRPVAIARAAGGLRVGRPGTFPGETRWRHSSPRFAMLFTATAVLSCMRAAHLGRSDRCRVGHTRRRLATLDATARASCGAAAS